MSDLPHPVRVIVEGLRTGARHPVEDAARVDVLDALGLELTHEYLGYRVVLRYSQYTAWHNGEGALEEFDLMTIKTD
jgi:hypothetical protein